MSALPLEADIYGVLDVCFRPQADMTYVAKQLDARPGNYLGVPGPRMKFCISSGVTKPSLFASIALKMRS